MDSVMDSGTIMEYASYDAGIQKAVELLSKKLPFNWAADIDTDSFDIMDGAKCTLAQLFGDYVDGRNLLLDLNQFQPPFDAWRALSGSVGSYPFITYHGHDRNCEKSNQMWVAHIEYERENYK